MWILFAEKGPNKGKSYNLKPGGELTVGRLKSNDIVLNDDMLSRQHCRIFCKEGKIYVVDLKSRNGTLVNCRSVLQVVELKKGDIIKIGGTEFLLRKKDVDELIGKNIANYVFKKCLGRGGEGVVYLAEQIHLKRKVAIKVLSKKLASQKKYRERFMNEARVAATLNHRRLIGIYDIIHENDHVFFSMEYMSHGSLGGMVVDQKKLPSKLVLKYVKEAAEGLAYLEERGMVHRDIKPANLMLDNERSLKLGDFGTAMGGDSSIGEDNVMGSPSFMSPEHIQGLSLDSRSDLYSLGCTAFRLIAGFPPFSGNNVREILEAHLHKLPPSFQKVAPDLPAHIAQKLDTLLEKEPDDRYPNVAVFIKALNEPVSPRSRLKQTKKLKKSRVRTKKSSVNNPKRIIRKKRPS